MKKIILILIFLISLKTWGGNVVGWTLTTTNKSTSGLSVNYPNGNCTVTTNTSNVTYTSSGEQSSKWNVNTDVYWTTASFSTTNRFNLSITSEMKSDVNGPRDFKIQYKVGNGIWIDINSIVLTSTQVTIPTINLPIICENKPNIYIRFLKIGTKSVAGGTIAPVGKSYIRNLNVNSSNNPIFTGIGNWNSISNWSLGYIPGVSDSLDSPIIRGKCTLTTNNTVHNLTIDSLFSLNINPLMVLTVNNNLINNNGTNGIIIKSDVSGTGSLLHNSNNVSATIQRYITGSTNLLSKKYHLVSVPISDNTYLSGIWLNSYLFTYIVSNNTWKAWNDPTINILNTHEGAMIFYPKSDTTYIISGHLNNGTYTPTITNGYNLIPNPYPSSIDWNLVTKTKVSNSIWIYDPSISNYEGYLNGVCSGLGHVTNIIPIGQSFFVKSTGNGLKFNNSIRTSTTKSFLKDNPVNNIIYLRVKLNDTVSDGIAIHFLPEATFGFDDNYDLEKFYGDSKISPQLSCLLDGEELIINSLPLINEDVTIPLKLKLDIDNVKLDFTIKGIQTFSNSEHIIQLEDKQLKSFNDLTLNNEYYSFTHSTSDDENRFVLHFQKVLSNYKIIPIISSREVTLNTNSEIISLYTKVYDIEGRLINETTNKTFNIERSGVYLIKILINNFYTETHKIVIL